MEAISFLTPRPGRTNSGKMRSRTVSVVSRTRWRTRGLWRRRRGRTVGKTPGGVGGCGDTGRTSAAGGVEQVLQACGQFRREAGRRGGVDQADVDQVAQVNPI